MARFITMILLVFVFFMGCSLFIVENGLMFPYHKNARVMEQFEAAKTFVSKNQNWHLGE